MSKSVRRRSLRLENQFSNPNPNVNNKTRASNNFTKLDIQFSKVNKPKNNSNQQPHKSLFGAGSLFDPKNNDHSNGSKMQVFPNISNMMSNDDVNEKMDSDRSGNVSPSILSSNAQISACVTGHCGGQNSPDTSSTFYEPDSTVDDDDLETDFMIDSNGPIPITSSVLIENAKMNIPIYSKASLKHKTGSEKPKKPVSVKKLTRCESNSVKTNNLPVGNTTVIKEVKPTNQRKNQANYSQNFLFDEYTSGCKETNLNNKKVLSTKRLDINKLSQRHLQTPTPSTPVISTKLLNCKSKPKNSPRIRKNPPTLKPKSQPKYVSPEVFVSDYDNNQPNSSIDMVLPTPSPHDLTKLDHSVYGNQSKILQDTNSSLSTPVTNSTRHLEKTSRYPLRHMSTSSPVIYDLPVYRGRINSLSKFDVSSSRITTNVKSKSKIAATKSTLPKSFAKKVSQFSQCSSEHESLLHFNTPQETLSDVYEFISTSPPPKRQSKAKKITFQATKSSSAKKTTNQRKPCSNTLLFSTPIREPTKEISSRKKITKRRTNAISNSKSFSDLTNNKTSKRSRINISKSDKNKEENFLSSLFSQKCQMSGQQNSIFNARNSRISQIFTNSNLSMNSPQTFINRTPSTPFQDRRDYNQPYGGMLAYIDSVNHNNIDVEMQELCDLFSMLKISDERDRTKSFLTYRDPGRATENPPRTRRIDAIYKKPRKLSLFRNSFMNYRQSSNSAVGGNEIPFSPISLKNSISNESNFRRFECTADTPVTSTKATNVTHLSAREILKSIATISMKLPNYFYADGEYNFDGFSDWN